jgi:hypothetical protein
MSGEGGDASEAFRRDGAANSPRPPIRLETTNGKTSVVIEQNVGGQPVSITIMQGADSIRPAQGTVLVNRDGVVLTQSDLRDGHDTGTRYTLVSGKTWKEELLPTGQERLLELKVTLIPGNGDGLAKLRLQDASKPGVQGILFDERRLQTRAPGAAVAAYNSGTGDGLKEFTCNDGSDGSKVLVAYESGEPFEIVFRDATYVKTGIEDTWARQLPGGVISPDKADWVTLRLPTNEGDRAELTDASSANSSGGAADTPARPPGRQLPELAIAGTAGVSPAATLGAEPHAEGEVLKTNSIATALPVVQLDGHGDGGYDNPGVKPLPDRSEPRPNDQRAKTSDAGPAKVERDSNGRLTQLSVVNGDQVVRQVSISYDAQGKPNEVTLKLAQDVHVYRMQDDGNWSVKIRSHFKPWQNEGIYGHIEVDQDHGNVTFNLPTRTKQIFGSDGSETLETASGYEHKVSSNGEVLYLSLGRSSGGQLAGVDPPALRDLRMSREGNLTTVSGIDNNGRQQTWTSDPTNPHSWTVHIPGQKDKTVSGNLDIISYQGQADAVGASLRIRTKYTIVELPDGTRAAPRSGVRSGGEDTGRPDSDVGPPL